MDRDLKYNIMQEIEKNCSPFRKVSMIRYTIRCPFCGDSQKDPKDMHLYLKCDYDNPNEPILYNCFLANCGAHGKVTKSFMEKLGIKSKFSKELSNQKYSKVFAIKETEVEILTGDVILDSPQVRYIEKRLGTGFTLSDYESFKIIWDMNSIMEYISNEKTRNSMPSNLNTISFLSDDKSTIISRGFGDYDKWRKTKILSIDNRLVYTIKRVFNIFTTDNIVVNIAEGIFDILSVYKNFNDGENSVYIATLGGDHSSSMEYIIAKGLVGTNVIVKIYLDSEIDEKKVKFLLKRYKYFYKAIYLYKNIKSHDVGVTIDQIRLIEYQV